MTTAGDKPLKGKQETFCQLIATHRKSNTQCYIEAGYEPKAAGAASTRLLKNVSVKDRIKYLERQTIETTEADILRIKTYLRQVIEDNTAPHSAKLKAADLLGKTAGIYVDNKQVNGQATVTFSWLNEDITTDEPETVNQGKNLPEAEPNKCPLPRENSITAAESDGPQAGEEDQGPSQGPEDEPSIHQERTD